MEVLATKWIRLLPFDENKHFDAYFELRNDPRLLTLWSGRRDLVTRLQLEDELRHDFAGSRHQFLTMIRAGHNDIIGFVYDYGFNSISGYAYTATIVRYDLFGKGYTVHAMALFIPYLFDCFNLRKLYSEVYDYNAQSKAILLKIGYQEESRLRAHVFFEGQYYDLITLSIYREDLDAVRKLRSRLQRENIAEI